MYPVIPIWQIVEEEFRNALVGDEHKATDKSEGLELWGIMWIRNLIPRPAFTCLFQQAFPSQILYNALTPSWSPPTDLHS
jgi:hypothetical protein